MTRAALAMPLIYLFSIDDDLIGTKFCCLGGAIA